MYGFCTGFAAQLLLLFIYLLFGLSQLYNNNIPSFFSTIDSLTCINLIRNLWDMFHCFVGLI